MPQWDFLDFLAEQGKRYPQFHVQMESPVEELVESNGRCVGVKVRTSAGVEEVNADLVIGADGRHSTVREQAGLKSTELGAPMDVLWFRVARKPGDPDQTLGSFAPGRIIIMINRGDYWQCGFVIRKDSFEDTRAQGLEAFRREVARQMRIGQLGAGELQDWDEVKLLTVTVDRLRQWYKPGLLCIGDAAHAMSPIGGVGINIAVQDAVAAANILASRFLNGGIGDNELRQVQDRRERAVRLTQYVQLVMQRRVISKVLNREIAPSAPLILKLANRLPLLRRLLGRLLGLGFEPEHVRTPLAH
jgi:2-polyprenyl-6-methoxyphenol hydroxylase-like FAD-dependent oxidoreductase